MAIFSDLELMGIMNESKSKEDDSILDSIEDRIKTNTGQVKDGIEKAKDNVKKNSWIGKKKAAKNESTNTITFREDSEGNIHDYTNKRNLITDGFCSELTDPFISKSQL